MFGLKKKEPTTSYSKHRPDLKNYSYDDLSFLYKFEHMTPEEQLFFITQTDFQKFVSEYGWLNKFGINFFPKVSNPDLPEDDFHRYCFTKEDGYNVYMICDRVEYEPWHQPITDKEYKQLSKMDLPKFSRDN